MEKLSSGAAVLDELLDGGYEQDVITTIYGPAGSGKTTTCLLAAISAAKHKKVIFIDTEGGYSPDRLAQLSGSDKKTTERLLVFHPTTFEDQKKRMAQLSQLLKTGIGLIICDTISALYRSERGEDNTALNRELGKQLGMLLEIARSKNIPVLVTTQVYADFENRSSVHLVGGDIITYSSKCILELHALANQTRRIILRKHRSLPEKSALFVITEKGFQKA